MTVVNGQDVEIAWPCEHDGMQGRIISVQPGVAYCQLNKPRGAFTRAPVIVKYPSGAYIPSKRKEKS